MKKRLALLAMVAALAVSAVACGNTDEKPKDGDKKT